MKGRTTSSYVTLSSVIQQETVEQKTKALMDLNERLKQECDELTEIVKRMQSSV